jgi:hypothetical protein
MVCSFFLGGYGRAKPPLVGHTSLHTLLYTPKRNGIAAESSIAVAFGLFSYAEFDVYICTNCGYTELYIADKRDLLKIAEQWRKVT